MSNENNKGVKTVTAKEVRWPPLTEEELSKVSADIYEGWLSLTGKKEQAGKLAATATERRFTRRELQEAINKALDEL